MFSISPYDSPHCPLSLHNSHLVQGSFHLLTHYVFNCLFTYCLGRRGRRPGVGVSEPLAKLQGDVEMALALLGYCIHSHPQSGALTGRSSILLDHILKLLVRGPVSQGSILLILDLREVGRGGPRGGFVAVDRLLSSTSTAFAFPLASLRKRGQSWCSAWRRVTRDSAMASLTTLPRFQPQLAPCSE